MYPMGTLTVSCFDKKLWSLTMQNTHVKFSETTGEFAEQVKTKPQTIRKRYSQTGSYYGIRPVKLPNGRLLWPTDAILTLTGREDK